MMDTTLELFAHPDFVNLRTIIDGEQICVCAKDAATALGYSNTKDAIRRYCEGVVKRYPLATPGGTQEFAFIYEGDLYRLILGSHLPGAQKFESWVMDEVLPSNRKHGLYATDRLLDEMRTNLRAFLAMVQAYVEEKERNEKLLVDNYAQAQLLLEARPKVTYCDMVLQSDSLLSTMEIAKDYGLSARKLNKLLDELGVQFKQSGRWFLYAEHAEAGYAQSKTFVVDEETGKTATHLYWTQKGRLFITRPSTRVRPAACHRTRGRSMTTTLTIPRLNASGCPGPVAFEVLKPEQRTRFGYRPLAYICSPYSGDVEANVQLARRMCGVAVERHRIPIAPHLLLPQFMDDTDPAQRELAMFFNRIVLSKCEEVWVYAPRITADMREEVRWARHLGTPITFLDHELEEILP